MGMPLGDPHGGFFEYTTEGLPESIGVCTVPVRDIGRSLPFYRDLLGMEVLHEDGDRAYLRRGSCNIILSRSETVGVDTGLYFGVDNPYNTRRRLIDEGVVFTMEPRRGPFGTYTSFRDDDGNIIHAIETGAGFRI